MKFSKTEGKSRDGSASSRSRGTTWAVVLFSLAAGALPSALIAQTSNDRPRVVVTTDGEVDDRSSFVRFLTYANDFDVEGIIPTNSVWQKEGHGTEWILEMIDSYAHVYSNLIVHDEAYPQPDALRERVFQGNEDRIRMHTVGPENDTPGSDRIVRTLLADDDRPVWLVAWGGTNTIAQALWRLKTSYADSVSTPALRKARVHAVAFQDETTPWIRENMPEVTLILNYQFTAVDYDHEGHPLSNDPMFSPEWMTENVKSGHGRLGAAYPQDYFSEGDSPSFFHLVDTGLRSTKDPSFGGWGGRFERKSASYPNYWTDAADDGDRLKPLWRWLPAISSDFAARMDWSVASYEDANHPPDVRVAGEPDRRVRPGKTVRLDASGSSDPDGDAIAYRWWRYADADTYPGVILIENADQREASFATPAVERAETIHIILTAQDSGTPSLTRYSRIVITVSPD